MQKNNMMHLWGVRLGILCVVVSALIIGGVAILFRVPVSQPDVSFRIVSGERVSSIATQLADDHLIRAPIAFLAYAWWSGHYGNFKPGTYQLHAQSMGSLMDQLVRGPESHAIILTPGMTVKEIDQKLSGAGIISPGSLEALSCVDFVGQFPFLAGATSFEGFFMPDTYQFFSGTSAHDVAVTLLKNFVMRTQSLLHGESPAHVQQAVTVASLLEKEVIDFTDKRLVAGIIYKRLADHMPLQIDASVLYGACGGTFLYCPPIHKADFKQDTPFNTYLHTGLPPHPIDNPALSSLQAALSPQTSSYWFYLTDPTTKQTLFSATFQEHTAQQVRVGI